PEGSSISSTRGFAINARAIASICCSPPESEAAIWCRRSLRRGKSADTVSSVHSIGRSPRGRRPATARFSRTVRLRKTRRPWGTSATPDKIDLPRARVGDDLTPRALDDHLAEVQHGDPLGEVERDVHVVLDHDDRHVAGDAADEGQHVTPLLEREPGERLVEQE